MELTDAVSCMLVEQGPDLYPRRQLTSLRRGDDPVRARSGFHEVPGPEFFHPRSLY